MQPLWYRNAVIYEVDVAQFADSNGDGWGDLRGLARRLDHIRGLGATTLWLLPFYPSPFRDAGYDVSDHLGVDPRYGDLADFTDLLETAEELGLRVIVELVVQHTSDQHPWFQEARRDRDSPYRDYYIWSDDPRADDADGERPRPVFPTVEDDVWTWDDEAGQYYRHMFYRHEPDLDVANPRVRDEIRRIMSFWLRLGVSGFRVDGAPYLVERARAADPREGGQWLLRDLRDFVDVRRPEAVLLGEVDVPPEIYADYFGDGRGLTLLLDFWINNHVFLGLARDCAEPIVRALREQPQPPARAHYVNWLRNHDELDLDQLSADERDEVWRRFAPEERMRAYGRGIRRRLAPMLDGDARRIEMAHALLLSLPGPPVLLYGDEIGMGDDLDRPERLAVRSPMQWADDDNGGFSAAPPDRLSAPVIADGPFGYPRVNVYDQALRDDSTLARISKMVRARLGLREFGLGACRAVDVDSPSVLALRHDLDGSTAVALVNLAPHDAEVRLEDDLGDLVDLLADDAYEPVGGARYRLRGYGYRWLRPRQHVLR